MPPVECIRRNLILPYGGLVQFKWYLKTCAFIAIYVIASSGIKSSHVCAMMRNIIMTLKKKRLCMKLFTEHVTVSSCVGWLWA